MNWELPDIQTGFRKGTGVRDQIANICWIIEKSRKFQKIIYFCFIEYAKEFVQIKTNCGIFLKRWKCQTTLPAFWETCMQVKRQQLELDGIMDSFQIGKGVRQGYILSPCLFNLYAEYIMQNTGLDESQAGIKTARRNINDLRYADDTTLMGRKQRKI